MNLIAVEGRKLYQIKVQMKNEDLDKEDEISCRNEGILQFEIDSLKFQQMLDLGFSETSQISAELQHISITIAPCVSNKI